MEIIKFCIKGVTFFLIWKTIILFVASRMADKNMSLDFIIFSYISIYTFIATVLIIIVASEGGRKVVKYLQSASFLEERQLLLDVSDGNDKEGK